MAMDLRIQMNKRILIKIGVGALGGLAAFAALLLYAHQTLSRYAVTPALPPRNAAFCKVIITPGQGVSQIARLFSSACIIRRPLAFKIYARLKGFDKKIKAGEYRLSAAMTPTDILEKLVKGDVVLYRLTIPEGYTMDQIASLVAETGLVTREDFKSALSDPLFLEKEKIEAESFEGYLFPDTYFFPRGVTSGKIIAALVTRFRSALTSERLSRAQTLGMTVHEVVTLAAIIEKETGAPEERPLISSVFHNRLKLGMRLESDPTVIYGIKDFNGDITRKDLAEETPYNTYQIKGLPKGPIANPGEAAIEAALYPADTAYLYFVARKDHTHYFSTNFEDHNRAVTKYQLH
jgi:UPF0755 protein